MYAPSNIVHQRNLGTVIGLVNYLEEMCNTQAPMVREPHDRCVDTYLIGAQIV